MHEQHSTTPSHPPKQVRRQQTQDPSTVIDPMLLQSLQQQMTQLQQQVQQQRTDMDKFNSFNVDVVIHSKIDEILPGEIRKMFSRNSPDSNETICERQT